MNSIIQKLPDDLINQIAAGEVIENPASVVKELIENSIDAKSTSIEVRVLAGGLQQIIISDNGSGMNEEDAALSFERHATSKLRQFDDLWSLSTMGFRGEALAAISSISKVTLTTSKDTPHATRVIVQGGKILSIQPASRQQGTTIQVDDLFYNTPARKSFQKSGSNSFSQIFKLIQQFALAHPEIEFSLYDGDRKALAIGASSQESSLLEQLEMKGALLFDEAIKEQFLPLEITKASYSITGWLGKPEMTKHNRQYQHLFINHRAVQCSFIQAILKQAYGTMIDGKKYPVCILHLHVDPQMIDINVHPQKKEIRFREDWKIQRDLFQDFESALLGPVTIHSVVKSDAPLAYRAYLSSSSSQEPMGNFNYRFNSSSLSSQDENPWQSMNDPLKNQEGKSSEEFPSSSFPVLHSPREVLHENNRESEPEEAGSPFTGDLPMRAIYNIAPIGIFETHLLLDAERSDLPFGIKIEPGILFIDLIQLEEAKTLFALQSKHPMQQRLLLPLPISLSSPFDEPSLRRFEEFGFSARALGKNSVVIEAIPEMISVEIAEELFLFLAEAIQEKNSSLSIEQKLLKAYHGKLTKKARFSMAEALGLYEWALSLAKGTPVLKRAVSFIPKRNIPKNGDLGGNFERVF